MLDLLNGVAIFILVFFSIFGQIQFLKIVFQQLFKKEWQNEMCQIGTQDILQSSNAEYAIRTALLHTDGGVYVDCENVDKQTFEIIKRLAIENNRVIMCQFGTCS
ncbi:MAG: hypothetical protein RSA99_01375 [Oscillospiraceae bacterium]